MCFMGRQATELIPIKISDLIEAFGTCSFSGHWILFARWAKGKTDEEIIQHLGDLRHTVVHYVSMAKSKFGDTVKINDISIDKYIAVI